MDTTKIAVDAATIYIKHKYGIAPNVLISCENKDCETLYVKVHLIRILYEIIKTGMTQTVEHHKMNGSISELPPVRIWISDGKEDVSFKIDDEGNFMLTRLINVRWRHARERFA
jgi:pyruvate dehydrogenase kinase 2/3/4